MKYLQQFWRLRPLFVPISESHYSYPEDTEYLTHAVRFFRIFAINLQLITEVSLVEMFTVDMSYKLRHSTFLKRSCTMFDAQPFPHPQFSFHREYIKLFLWPQRVPHNNQSTLRKPAMAGSHKCNQVLVESWGAQIPCGWSPRRINCTLTLKIFSTITAVSLFT